MTSVGTAEVMVDMVEDKVDTAAVATRGTVSEATALAPEVRMVATALEDKEATASGVTTEVAIKSLDPAVVIGSPFQVEAVEITAMVTAIMST